MRPCGGEKMQEQVVRWITNNIVTILVALSVVIQIAPIKINPWSTILKWIGKIIIGDLDKTVTNINSTLTKLEKDVTENEKDRIRWEILDFANSCRNGRRHTKDEFQHIIALNDKYKALLAKTNDKNGVFEMEYAYIKNLYTERQIKNDFL